MKKKFSDFPWYLIYTPVITVILILWYLEANEVVTMDILEKILMWLGLDDNLITNVVIIAVALIAWCYTIAKLRSSNKTIAAIKETADTSPAQIKEHINSKHDSICAAIREDKTQLNRDIASMNSSIGFLTAQRPTVPVQQSQLLAEINSLYALHDRDQRTIAEQKELIDHLQTQNATLKKQKAYLQQRLDKLTPEHEQTLSL